MKTSELTGEALSYAVAKCLYPDGYMTGVVVQMNYAPGHRVCVPDVVQRGYRVFRPGLDWSQGGPIIERERMQFRSEQRLQYRAFIGLHGAEGVGPTHLVAAMRCFVLSKLGDEVEIPEALR